jgi:Chaperone of endosialidase
MALNFPDAPQVGDTFTSGGFTWVWNGVTWDAAGGSSGGGGGTPPPVDVTVGVPEAPLDGQQYGRENAAWTPVVGGGGGAYLPLDGSAPMTGDLTLFADPTLPMHATTRQYVDGAFQVSIGLPGTIRFINAAGDEMTGELRMADGAPLTLDAPAGTPCTLFGQVAGKPRWGVVLGNTLAEAGGNTGSNFEVTAYDDAGTALWTPLLIERSSGTVFVNAADAAPYSTSGALDPQSCHLMLNKAGSGKMAILDGLSDGLLRWQVVLGNSSPEDVTNGGSGFGICRFDNAGVLVDLPMQISRSNGFTTFSQPIIETSDSSLKTDVRTVEGALGIIEQLQGVFYRKAGVDKDQVGLIAEDVEPVLPEVVFDCPSPIMDGEPVLGVAYGNVVAVLINAVKELSAKVTALEAASGG